MHGPRLGSHTHTPNTPLPPQKNPSLQIHVWNWRERTLRQTIDLGPEGLIPLEIRFQHNPDSPHGYVGAALSSNIIGFEVGAGGEVATRVAVRQAWLDVEGWALPQLPPLITDILISLNDQYL